MISRLVEKIKKAPQKPGVYIFFCGSEVLYVGKASHLRNRLKSYLKITDIKTKSLHEEATRLETRVLRSNIEALIVESQLIKKLKPKYNVLFRDDKSYFYVYSSHETFPRIYIGHRANTTHSKWQTADSHVIGPFTDGNALKAILRMLRRQFPYCTCKPHLRVCLNAQIGNCPGYCCQKHNTNGQEDARTLRTQEKEYRKNIRTIENILTGKNRSFLKTIQDPYNLLVLEKIWAHQPYLESGNKNLESREGKNKGLDSSYQIPDSIQRAECYDNSHLAGKEAVGAMTAWQKENGTWVADKNSWRKFKHANSTTFAAGAPLVEDDPAMMEDMITRRLNHPEWTYPDLMIIDGGITQFRAAKRALDRIMHKGSGSAAKKNKSVIHNSKFIIPKVISFAKPNQEVYGWKPLPVPIAELPAELQKLIPMAIQNTHNFVIRYHRSVRRRVFLPPQTEGSQP